MDLLDSGLFRIMGFAEDKVPAMKARTSSESAEHQPLMKKPKPSPRKPKVSTSVDLESAQSANLYDGTNSNLRALLAGLPSSQTGDWEKGVHKAPRIDHSGLNPACFINGKVLTHIVLD
jgi:hypothetical protein